MKITNSITLLLLAGLTNVVNSQSPFYYQANDHEYHSTYSTTGKMEQIGRTGVAAMHAVLLK